MLRGQNKTEVIKEVIVDFLHILGSKNIFYPIFIEIELSLTTLKLLGSHYCTYFELVKLSPLLKRLKTYNLTRLT